MIQLSIKSSNEVDESNNLGNHSTIRKYHTVQLADKRPWHEKYETIQLRKLTA